MRKAIFYSRQRSDYFVSVLDREAAPLPLPVNPARSAVGRRPLRNTATISTPPGSIRTAFRQRSGVNASSIACGRVPENSPGMEIRKGNGLRRTIQLYLERSRGVVCEPDQIVICAGLQQSLDMVAQLLKPDHASVAVENPGYHLPPRSVPQQWVCRRAGCRHASGLDLELLRASGVTGCLCHRHTSSPWAMSCPLPAG